MHYSLEDPNEHRNHGMAHNPFKALVAPRPIGWISAISKPALRAKALMRLAEFQQKLDPKNIFGSVVFRQQTREQLGERVDALLEELSRWDAYVGDGPFLCGDQFTLVDIAVFPLLMHFEALGYDFAKHAPSLFAYMNHCKARPSVVQSGWVGNFLAFVRKREPGLVLAG